MLNGRIYRAALVPLLFALAIAGFSLSGRPSPLTSTLAPDAFDGSRAFAELQSLAARYRQRRPGSQGDAALGAHIAQTLEGLGGMAASGFSVHTRRFQAQTLGGERTLTTVIARRPGITGGSPIVLLAHRDAAGPGAPAELSGTAVLLELARVFAASETQRTVILVSTGGSEVGAGADFATHASPSPDAAIVLGDLAGAAVRKPFVAPFSDGLGSAPVGLQRTLSGALAQEVGVDPGAPSVFSQLAHLTLPLTAGEEGPLNAHGTPAVLLQVSGERGPAAGESVSAGRLQNFGRAVLSAVYALDGGPDLPGGLQTGVVIQRKVLPEWALRLLLAALLAPPLLVAVDGFARLRRRGVAIGRWVLWALACSAPFLAAAALTRVLGLAGVIAAPRGLVLPGALPTGSTALEAVLAPVLLLVLAWLGWPALMRRLGLPTRAGADAAGLSILVVLLGVAIAVWLSNPFTALLFVPALHLWLLVVSPEWRHAGGRWGRAHHLRALVVVALGVAPLTLLFAFYARQLGFDAGQAAHAVVLLLAGGHISVVGMVLWSLAFGCLAGATLVALTSPSPLIPGEDGEQMAITVRGPMSYAGPGSLGGTESALRR